MRTCIKLKVFRMAAWIGVMILLAGFVPITGTALLIAKGGIDGTITCEGNPVADVVVSVSGPLPATDIIWAGTTNSAGRYYTDMILPPGTYTVRHYYIEGICQYAEVTKSATVQAGLVTTVNFAGTYCADLLRNGGFESTGYWDIGLTPWPAGYTTRESHTGSRSMRSGIEPPHADRVSESSFYQQVTIPADVASATLTFWYKPFTEESVGALSDWQQVNWAGYSPEKSLAGEEVMGTASDASMNPTSWYAYDWQEVLILDSSYRLLEVLQRGLSNDGAGGWIYKSYDFTPYRGRTITVYFNTINNGYGNKRTWMYVDDVKVHACAQPPACVVTPTNQWVNLYGVASTFHSAPLSRGQIVEAWDPDGVLAGCFVVRSSGRYGAMPVYADDPETPADEGCEPGDAIRLTIDGEDAFVLGPDESQWTENGDLLHVELAVGGIITRHISLHAGWNLISFDVMPTNTAVEAVLAPIAGQFTRVLGSTCDAGALSYYPSLPPSLNTLRHLDPYHGYWIFMSSAATLPVAGVELPDSLPLELCERWNLVSYLPDGPLPLTQALHTITGKYTVVLGFDRGALSYYTDLPPEMNSLQQLKPSFGYWIRASEAATLIYPAAGLGLLGTSKANLETRPAGVQPTYRWADAYSLDSSYGGKPLPVGALVEVFDPDGVKVGSFVVTEEGCYGPLPIYGDDPSTPEDEGAQIGDLLTFTINGKRASTVPLRPTWPGEYVLMRVDLNMKNVR